MTQKDGESRYVVLRHTLPDGDTHLDWMIEVDQDHLVSFRIAVDVNPVADRGFEATRIAPHRRAYLDYQGPVSGGRGEVTRIGEGQFLITAAAPDRLELLIAGRTVVGTPVRSDTWVFKSIDRG